MNSIVIPPSPNWYLPDILACAPDGTLVYGSHMSIVIIKPKPEDQPADIKLISFAHHERISCISLNSKWDDGNRLIASAGEDKAVKVWNCDSLALFKAHNSHTTNESKLIGATYAGSDKVISVSEDGMIIVWKVSTNELNPITNLFKGKTQVTSLASCPHAPWLCAFGLKNGLVIVADLRLSGQIKYKLKGHEKNVTDLSWCPVPVNIFPKLKTKQITLKDRIQKIYDEAKTENNPPLDRGDGNAINTPNKTQAKNLDSNETTEDIQNAATNQTEKENTENLDSECAKDLQQNANTKNSQPNPNNELQIKQTDNATQNLEHKSKNETQDAEKFSVENGTQNLQLKSNNETQDVEMSSAENAENKTENLQQKSSEETQDAEKFSVKNAENTTENATQNLHLKSNNETQDADMSSVENITENGGQNLQQKPNNETHDLEISPVKNAENTTENKTQNLQPKSNNETQDAEMSSLENGTQKLNNETQNAENSPLENASSQEEIEELQKVLEKNKENTLKSSACYKFKTNNPWVNLKHADDDEIPEEEKPAPPQERDFLKECVSLREKITGVAESKDDNTDEHEEESEGMMPRRILKARKAKRLEECAAASNIEDDLFSGKSEDDLISNKGDDDLHKSIDELLDDTEKNKSALEKVTDVLEKITIGCNKVEVKAENKVVEEEEEFISEESRKEFLLASVSSNGSIIIWRAGTDGKVQTKLSISNKQKFRNARAKDKVWMCMCWIAPTILLSSGGNGELLQWDLKNHSNGILKSRIVHGDHQSMLFSIAAPVLKVLPAESANWREQSKSNALTAWTVGQERMLLNTTVDLQRKTVACYPTLGNSVQCLAASTIDPNKLAAGTADGLIKIWDLSKPHLQYVTMTTFKVKPQSKVLHLAWHPEQEGVLAYGTEEGHVGLINPSCSSKPPTLLVHYFRSSIHKLEWGPMKTKENLGLYSCSEGVLILYDTKNPVESPTVIQTPDGKYITQFSWKQDNSILALGTKDGTIILFTHDLEYQTSLFYQQKGIVSLHWHPQATAEDEDVSPYESWLASSSSDGGIVVYDMRNCTDDVEISTRVVAELKDHTKFVRAMSWSPHEGGKLVSASEDGSAHIWDVKNKVVLSTYLNSYCQPITACTWSPLDSNYIIMGGRQCTLQILNVNDYKPMTKAEIQKELNKRKKKFGAKSVKEEQKTEQVSIVKKNVNCRDLVLASITNLQRDKDSLLKDCQQLMALNEVDSTVDRSKNQVLQLFGTQEDVHKLIQHQQESHASKSKHTLNHHLSLWKGDISESIRKAMTEGQLSPWLISMAPMVSPTLWQEACESYANQLADDPNGDAVQAASYYLSCHKTEKAVEVLCSKKLFKEALVLTKCRLPNEKSLIDKVILEWAMYYIVNGSYEVSAQCYIALGKYEEAAKALYKRSDVEILSLAVELAEKSGNPEMVSAIKHRYDTFKTQNESESPKAAAKNQLPTRIEVAEDEVEFVVSREESTPADDSDNAEETELASKIDALVINGKAGDDE